MHYTIKVLEANIITGEARIFKLAHGSRPDLYMGRDIYAIVDGKFPCSKASYIDKDTNCTAVRDDTCHWCDGLRMRIASRARVNNLDYEVK